MMLSQHSQLSQYQGLIRVHGGNFSAEESQALNLTTNPQQYHHQQRPHQHQQLQQQQQQQQQNYAMVMSVQDLQSRPVQRVSPAVQPAGSNMSHDIPDDIMLKAPEGGNHGRRGSGDVTTIEVPLSRYSSVLASALPTVTSDGNALQIKRKDFIASRKKREFVTEQAKDNCYWDKRKKNNEAAKRSREKRRLNDIVLEARVLDLTQENDALREKLDVFAERFGIDDIDSVSVEDLRDLNYGDSPLVTIKQEVPSSPPPSHTEVVAKDLANECIIVENTLHQRSAHDHQRQSSQYCHNQAKQLNSVSMTMQRAAALAQESNSANSHHQSSVQCAAKVPVVSAASPVGIHVPSQYQLNSQSHRYKPSEMISALIIKDGPNRTQSTTTTNNDHVPNREVNRATYDHGNHSVDHIPRSVPTALAKLYGMEQKPASSVAEQLPKGCEYSDTVLPKNTKKSNSMPSLVDGPQDGQWYSPDTRERKISQSSDDSALGDKSPSHSVFAGAETHKLPHKLRCKPGRSATPTDSFPHESSSSHSSLNSAELSPRALVIDVSNHQANDFSRAVEISGIYTPPSSIEQSGDDSLPSSPVSLTSGPEELAKQCNHPNIPTGAKPTFEPYRKMVLAAQKLAMVSSDTDSLPESSKRVHCGDNEEQQYWGKRRRNNDHAVHGLPVAQHQATQQGQVPQRSSYLEFENSQLRNELKMLSQDVASLKNLIQSK